MRKRDAERPGGEREASECEKEKANREMRKGRKPEGEMHVSRLTLTRKIHSITWLLEAYL